MKLTERSDAELSRWIKSNLNDDSWLDRDMVNDQAMTVMLLEKMQEQFRDLILHSNYIRCEPAIGKYYEAHGKLGRAVAEAYALAHGFTEE